MSPTEMQRAPALIKLPPAARSACGIPKATRRTDACGHRPKTGGPGGYTLLAWARASRTRTTRNGQSIPANRSHADAIASCSATSCRCLGTGVGARSFQYGAEARSASVQQ